MDSPQSAGGVARAAKLSPERRASIASAAAKARWKKECSPTTRITLTLRSGDLETVEALRAKLGFVSAGAVLRQALREFAKARLSI